MRYLTGPVVVLGLLAACLIPAGAARGAYVIVTTDGQRLEVIDPPSSEGKTTRFRLAPAGTLSSLPTARIDWKATEAANAQPAAPAATPTAPPDRVRRLQSIAGKLSIDESRANASGDTMKVAGNPTDMAADRWYFGEKSVAQYLEAGELYLFSGGCPLQRAYFAGTIRNASPKKISGLRALVVLRHRYTGQTVERIESTDPPNLMPGEEAKVLVVMSCDSAAVSMGQWAGYLRDVSGNAEELARPGKENPFARPTPKASP